MANEISRRAFLAGLAGVGGAVAGAAAAPKKASPLPTGGTGRMQVNDRTIRYDRHGFIIGGKRRILLAGTVSYYRIAPDDWEPRLQMLKDCGFNTVDTYVPWNMHEAREGEFDFTTGRRHLAGFLAACQRKGLFVYLRPGPYICNEWDGGGLPAWLFTQPGVRVRQNDGPYLNFVKRYLSRVNRIAREHLWTHGGPIVLYAVENELDFFPCKDPHGYVSTLRDLARADGIDVPMVGCIGGSVNIAAATGLAEGIIPTPNCYLNGDVERQAAGIRDNLHAGQFRNGQPMGDLPAFVTEMGRGEDHLRRFLSVGMKGLGPFNFAAGSNFDRWNGLNNWGGLTYISTSVDFGGMVAYNGLRGPSYGGARRVGGLVSAFEAQIAACDPVTSASGGPTCDNPRIGAPMGEGATEVCSLQSGNTAFVFLHNGTRERQTANVTMGRLTFPVHSTLVVPPGATPVVTIGATMQHVGLPTTIRYCTAEVAELSRAVDGARIVLYGDRGAQGEISIGGAAVAVAGGTSPARVATDAAGAVFVFHFGARTETRVRVGGKFLTIVAMTGADVGNGPQPEPALPDAQGLMDTAWQAHDIPRPPFKLNWEGDGRPLETLGVLHGAGWHELTIPGLAAGSSVEIEHASDIVSVYVDDRFLFTRRCDGGPLSFEIPHDLEGDSHRLVIRAEIWGHSNFDDTQWPVARIGSLRGLFGHVLLDGKAVRPAWRFGEEPLRPEPAGPRTLEWKVAPGAAVLLTRTASTATGRGEIVLNGHDCHGEVYAGGEMVGRFVFGPEPEVKMVGGPANRFYVPGSLLKPGARLEILLRGAGTGGGLTEAVWHSLVPLAQQKKRDIR